MGSWIEEKFHGVPIWAVLAVGLALVYTVSKRQMFKSVVTKETGNGKNGKLAKQYKA